MQLLLLLAEVDFATGLGKIVGFLNAISMVLFFGGLIVSAILYGTGRTDHLATGIISAGIGGLSWVIVKAIFQAVGSGGIVIEMQGF